MTFLTLSTVLGVLLLGAMVTGLVYLILFLIQQIGGTTGGWRRLSKQFESTLPVAGVVFKHQTVQVGAVVYKGCVTIGVADEGMYVAIWRQTALVPWSEFKAIGQVTLYWKKIPSVTIGNPAIASMTIPPAAFEEARKRLPHFEQSDP